MPEQFSRRHFFGAPLVAGAAGLARGEQQGAGQPERIVRPEASLAQPFQPYDKRSAVSLISGDNRRRIVHDALVAIDDQILPALKRKRYVIIKPNIVSTVNQLAATHAETLHGILDYLEPRFKGPVVIAESSAGDTWAGYENFRYTEVVRERRSQKVSLVDLNDEGTYKVAHLIDYNLHLQPVRLAARLFDPDAFILCAAILKTHNTVIATLSVKNLTLGAPIHQSRKEKVRWNDKRRYHEGVRQTHYNIYRTAEKMVPYWGATIIDGYEGMEGNGPASGTPVPSRVAIASTDYIAADRVGVEVMGIDPEWLGYLKFCWQGGLGQYDLNKIDVRGVAVAAVQRKYRLHKDIERELEWMGPIRDLPPKLG